MPTLPPVFQKLNHFLQLYWRIILIVVIFELVVIIGTAHLTYILSNYAACETDIIITTTIRTSTVTSFTKTSTISETPSTTIPVSISSTHAPSNNLSCYIGFELISGKCLQLLTGVGTRVIGTRSCWSRGGSKLFSIKNQQENSAILDFVIKNSIGNVWTGLVCKGNTTSSCIWDIVSGSAESYDNLASGYPNVTTASCVYFITTGKEAGQLRRDWCNQNNSILCELPPTVYDKNCERNFNNHCYLRFDYSYTIAEAHDLCKTMCVEVVSINSGDESRYIQSIYNVKEHITLGAAVLNRDDIYWLDGSLSTYNNIRNYNNETCAMMSLSWDTGYWTATECSSNGFFLCKRPAGIECVN